MAVTDETKKDGSTTDKKQEEWDWEEEDKKAMDSRKK